jgi:Tetratricopeptide repeat
MHGLNEVAPGFSKAWLASAYLAIIGQDYDTAIAFAQNAMRSEPDAVEAMLLLASCLLITGDFNSAGTYLGEVGERIEMGTVKNPNVSRLFKMQLARYQSR